MSLVVPDDEAGQLAFVGDAGMGSNPVSVLAVLIFALYGLGCATAHAFQFLGNMYGHLSFMHFLAPYHLRLSNRNL